MARGDCRNIVHEAVEQVFDTANKIFEKADKLIDQVLGEEDNRKKIRIKLPLKALERLGRGEAVVFRTDEEVIEILLKGL